MRSKAATKERNDASPVVEVHACLVAKYSRATRTTGLWQMRYLATFEFEDGLRSEFMVSGEDYNLIAKGDRGTLRHQGTRYLSFKRTSQETCASAPL